VAEREASGDFDYLIGDPAEAPADTEVPDDVLPAAASPDESDQAIPVRNGAFDAFDTDTWYFEPAAPPWYRRKQALTALLAAAAAASALMVATVLLVFRSPGTAEDGVTSVEPTASTTAVSTELASTSRPPPSPPPPPPETSAAPIDARPAQTARPQSPSTRTTKAPEIGVTRTPVTRSPISVAPGRPGSR
jgi:hypothetical protein